MYTYTYTYTYTHTYTYTYTYTYLYLYLNDVYLQEAKSRYECHTTGRSLYWIDVHNTLHCTTVLLHYYTTTTLLHYCSSALLHTFQAKNSCFLRKHMLHKWGPNSW